MKPPRTRYARSDNLNIAYQVFGDGPFDLVYVPGFVSHLDLMWEQPTLTGVLRRWASFARVISFDKRNTGLSDRTSVAPTLEERMDDIRAVMDAAGSDRAAVVGTSEGGPLALTFAATYPQRAVALVLASTYSRVPPRPDMDESLSTLERYWGSGLVLPFFLGIDVDTDWAARYERSAATPRGAVELLRLNAEIDVTHTLPAIHVPTLVVHRTGDPLIPIASARELAAHIEGARLVELEGDTHGPATDEAWDEETDIVEEFLTGARRSSSPERVLATVLFTDIVGSTEQAAAMGDERWRQHLERHHTEVRRALTTFRGREVKETGDGVLATFDGPARAIRCAAAITERALATGLPVRAGLHAGEVELIGDDVGGIAVHIAQRVEAAATAGSVFVSQTVRDLVVGSGIEFAERGAHELKGVSGTWHLYEVVSA